jgi:anti-sigma-K factor RskA
VVYPRGSEAALRMMVSATTRVSGYRKTARGVVEAIAAIIAVLVAVASWYAGTRYSRLKNEQLTAELADAEQRVADLQVSLKQEAVKRTRAEQALKNVGAPAAATQLESIRQKAQHLEADVNQYKAVIARDHASLAENMRVINALSEPSVRLLPLKGGEAAPATVAYALVAENSKLLMVASNLPVAEPSKRFQLWLHRRDDPRVVSGGVFSADDNKRAVVEFSDSELINNISAVSITEEPAGGSPAPTGAKILSTLPE